MIADWAWSSLAKLLFFHVIFLVLWGCASTQLKPPESLEYRASGKISARVDGRSSNANFRWQQGQGQYQIEIWGLLGQGRTWLRGNSEFMTVTRGDEVLAQGAPQDVMQTHLGFYLPVEVMWAWLTGEAATPDAEVNQGVEGHIDAISEFGWRVELARHKQFFGPEGAWQPARIVAQKAPLRLTVAIREFHQ